MLATQALVSVETLRRLHVILSDIGAGQDVDAALRAVAQAVVDVGGFGVACAHLVRGDEVVVVAVAGPADARAALHGHRSSRAVWERLLEEGEKWGVLRFHRDPRSLLGEMRYWVPPADTSVAAPDEDRWGPYDTVVAPMRSATGDLIGVLVVDQPADGLLPDQTQRELLEIFAVQTGLALDNHRLASDLETEHERVRTSEETLRIAFENAPVGMCLIRAEPEGPGRIVRVNGALCQMFGYSADEFARLSVVDLVDVGADPGGGSLLEAVIGDRTDPEQIECRCVRADRTTFWGQFHVAVVPGTEGQPTLVLGQLVDVTDRRQSEEELAHRAAHDPLTGLVNRTVLGERLGRLLEAPRDEHRPGAVLFCDLDHFKQVNDAHGHLIGDEVLASVARRIAAIVRRSDTVGRYGGDEFLVIVPEISAEEARELAMRVVRAVDEPILVAGTTCRVGASVGVMVLTDAASAAEVLEGADEAMYRAKTRFGRDRYVVHDIS